MSELPPYRPIDCGAHDRLLALATRGTPCSLDIGLDAERVSQVHGVIVDVYSSEGAEYLRLADGRIFRLDYVRAIDRVPLPPAPALEQGEQG